MQRETALAVLTELRRACDHPWLAKRHIAHRQAAAAAEARSAEEEEEQTPQERSRVREVTDSLAGPFSPSAKLNAVMGIVRDHSGALLLLHAAWLIMCEAVAQKAEACGACIPHSRGAPYACLWTGPAGWTISGLA